MNESFDMKECFNIDELEDTLRELANDNDIKICCNCNKLITEGIDIENEADYYCSEECLEKDMPWEEYVSYCKEIGKDANMYWTEWFNYSPTIYNFLKRCIDFYPELKLKY